MALEPTVYIINDTGAITPQADTGNRVIVLGQSQDGPSLNVDRALIQVNDPKEILKRLGPNFATQVDVDTLLFFYDLAQSPVLFGRITGAGGAKAATAQLVNITPTTPGNALIGTWRGLGINGNLYSLRVSRGSGSTTDTGAGRLDTNLELILTSTLEVIDSLDGLIMDATKTNYLVARWNELGTLNTLVNSTPGAAYTNTLEPAVGTFAFTAGVNPAVATSTELQAAATKLDAISGIDFALLGITAWPAVDVNVLAGFADAHRWVIIDYLADGTSKAAAKTHNEAVTVNTARVASHAGWGKATRNVDKRIPGLGQVLAQAIVTARAGGGRLVNVTGAGQAIDRWVAFDTDGKGWADGRTNPLYFRRNDRYGDGVVIGDVLSLSKARRYAQWGSRRADDLIIGDVLEYLENVVKLSPDFPWGNLKTDDATKKSADKTDDAIVALFSQYPAQLLTGARGIGWDWRFEDIIQGTDGPEPIFLLGTDPARVGRIFYVRVGQVAGRFTVTGTQAAQGV